MKANKQYAVIVKWLSSNDGTCGIYFSKPLKPKTLKLLLINEVDVQIKILCDSFIIKR